MLVTVSACSDLDQRKKQGGPARLRSVNIKPPTTIKAFFPLPLFFVDCFLGSPSSLFPTSLSLSLSLSPNPKPDQQAKWKPKIFSLPGAACRGQRRGPRQAAPGREICFLLPKKMAPKPWIFGFPSSKSKEKKRRRKKRKEEEQKKNYYKKKH